ncbi:hypothetical protein BDZ91DRAFT_722641 [Kalaharituber pfeilii]|nr:hypothetical protein BDZ91DRAFT_722641 [Kalaharituber pfeilii]
MVPLLYHKTSQLSRELSEIPRAPWPFTAFRRLPLPRYKLSKRLTYLGSIYYYYYYYYYLTSAPMPSLNDQYVRPEPHTRK